MLEIPALVAGVIAFALGHAAQISAVAKLPFAPELRNLGALALAMISVAASAGMAIGAAVTAASRIGAPLAIGAAVYMILVGSIAATGAIRGSVFFGASYLVGAHLIQASDLIIVASASDRSGVLIMSLYWIGTAALASVPSYLAFFTGGTEESRN